MNEKTILKIGLKYANMITKEINIECKGATKTKRIETIYNHLIALERNVELLKEALTSNQLIISPKGEINYIC